MPRRFDQYYKTRRLDNLGDPDWHDRRWSDIDLRMANREYDAQRIDDAVDRIEATALARLNSTFSPIIQQALDQLADIGISFTAQSFSDVELSLGTKTFIITEQYRPAFVVVDFVSVRPTGQFDNGMICTVSSYNRSTGALVVEPIVGYVVGLGYHADWTIKVSITPNLDTYSRGELDDKFADFVGDAPPELNTIAKMAEAMAHGGTLLIVDNNLSELTNTQAARNNLGLGQVDNTRDMNKPVSIAAQQAISAAVSGALFASTMITNLKVQMSSYLMPSDSNAHSVGPIVLSIGVVVTIPSGSRWVIS
jgi:hypothetical protein